jgi:hypothetical protein
MFFPIWLFCPSGGPELNDIHEFGAALVHMIERRGGKLEEPVD